MRVQRVMIAVALTGGLCVCGFARFGDRPVAAQTTAPLVHEPAEDEDGARDEAAARYRTNQPRHWRYVAIGSGH